jgi:hypothetical protein
VIALGLARVLGLRGTIILACLLVLESRSGSRIG